MIEVRGLSKVFGARKAVDNVSFSLPPDSFLSVFGPNGAGKTTLLHMLATLTRPSAGRIVVGGVDAKGDPNRVRALVGVISHQSMLYPDLTAEENLIFYGKLYGVDDPRKRARELLDAVALSHRRLDPVSALSRGMIQRVSIARALVHDPAVVLLDEPYTGLDSHGTETLDQLIANMRDRHSFVMVTHDLTKGFRMATHVLVMNQGKEVLFDTADEVGFERLSLIYRDIAGRGMVG